jgi:hypothetical protein
VLRRCIFAPLENADEIEERSVSWLHSFAGRFVADTAARSAVGFESSGARFATSVFQCGGGSAFIGLGRCATAELDSRDDVVVISHVVIHNAEEAAGGWRLEFGDATLLMQGFSREFSPEHRSHLCTNNW